MKKKNKLKLLIQFTTLLYFTGIAFAANATVDFEEPVVGRAQQNSAFDAMEKENKNALYREELILQDSDFLEETTDNIRQVPQVTVVDQDETITNIQEQLESAGVLNNQGQGMHGEPGHPRAQEGAGQTLGIPYDEPLAAPGGMSEAEGALPEGSFDIVVEDVVESEESANMLDDLFEEDNFDSDSSTDIVKSITTSSAKIKIIDKFAGKTYELQINDSEAINFEDDLFVRLDKCWMEPNGNLIQKHTALIDVLDTTSKRSDQFMRHWVFSHNVELNTFSTEKYHILLDSCVQ